MTFARSSYSAASHRGFTLVELAIVLVIIGLIVGGVLVGVDMLGAAGVNSVVSQIQKYNAAAAAFRLKYNAMPGDLPASVATMNGFAARGTSRGQGDNNGLLEWPASPASYNLGTGVGSGELALFWRDLSDAKLIDGTFTVATNSWAPGSTYYDDLWPKAKIGRANYIYVLSGGVNGAPNVAGDGRNYFGISVPVAISANWFYSNSGLTVAEAFSIDQKVDDGLPQAGTVQANYAYHNYTAWASGSPYGWGGGAAPGVATAASSTTCYDNGNNATNPMKYSMGTNKGAGVNCGLTFRFQQ